MDHWAGSMQGWPYAAKAEQAEPNHDVSILGHGSIRETKPGPRNMFASTISNMAYMSQSSLRLPAGAEPF